MVRSQCAVCTPPDLLGQAIEQEDEIQELIEALEAEQWGEPFPARYYGLCAADREHEIEPGDLIARMPGGAGYACEDCTPGKA